MTGQSANTSTKAIATLPGGRTELREVPVRAIESGEILLAVRVCGLCGTDLFKLANDSTPEGSVLGHELVGTVEHSLSSAYSGGERMVVPHHVACGECAFCERGSETLCERFREDLLEPGGFSEKVLVARRAVEHAARRIPDSMTDEAAVFLEPAACVLRGIRRAQLTGASTVAAILGGGSMGLLHLLVLKAIAPGCRILLVDPIEERRRLALELGAEDAAAPDSGDLSHRAKALGDGLRGGLDAVFDTVGGGEPFRTGLALLREGGTLVLFAHALRDPEPELALNSLFKSERRIIGTYSGSIVEQREIWRLLERGSLDPAPLVTHRLPLSRFEHAVELCRTHQALKILLEP